MDEPNLAIEFGMRRRSRLSHAKYAILKRELSFLKLNVDFKAASPKCKMKLVNNLVRAL